MSGLTCKTCDASDLGSLHNDDCFDCYAIKQNNWTAKMAIRQDPDQFDMASLIAVLLSSHWMHECIIVPAYMPPHPDATTRPRCAVYWQGADGQRHWLRHSKGPLQGHAWDVYGDDYLRPELALLAISQAPPPPRIDFVIPTHGK